jgi:hypothetical protein
MSTLRELQSTFAASLLGDDAGALGFICDDGIGAGERLEIYRNNVVSSLTRSLEAMFPCVRNLVDSRFFAYSATRFVRAHPPRVPCLAEYGEAFPDFLAALPACVELPYIGDVARLEWLMQRAAQAGGAISLPPSDLAAFGAEEAPLLGLTLHPSLGLLSSPFPIDRIWRAHRPGGSEEAVALDEGAVHLQVARGDGTVFLRPLHPSDHEFRVALQRGAALAVAAESALASQPDFDIAASLASLFADGLVVGLTARAS